MALTADKYVIPDGTPSGGNQATQSATYGDSDITPTISHLTNTSNPHGVTKTQLSLGNVDNTSDASKPVSTATQTALNAKEPTVTAGTTSQYYRGDKSFETLNLGAVAFDVNAQTVTSYTLLDSDHGKLVTLSNASAITLTVPSGLRSDFYCSISQIGAGLVSVAESGSTVNNFDSHTDLAGQYAMASIIAITAANTFLLQGRTA